jgi:hypothetical protein
MLVASVLLDAHKISMSICLKMSKMCWLRMLGNVPKMRERLKQGYRAADQHGSLDLF